MKLMQLQRTMARAVMQPLTSSERMQRRAPGGGSMKRYASRFIKPNDRLTSFERLEIYNRQYWFRVLSALGEDFPGLRAVLGERASTPWPRRTSLRIPRVRFTLRDLGSSMESWLRKNPQVGGQKSDSCAGYCAARMGGHRGLRRKSRSRLCVPKIFRVRMARN